MLVFLAWIPLNDISQGIHRKSKQCSHLPLDYKFQQNNTINSTIQTETLSLVAIRS